MSLLLGLLPKCVNFRRAAFFHAIGEECGFDIEQFHWPPVNDSLGKKSARELRQGESDYRCCIPALAGFVSPQSIAPDGKRISQQHWHRATLSRRRAKAANIDKLSRFCLHPRREMVRVALADFSY